MSQGSIETFFDTTAVILIIIIIAASLHSLGQCKSKSTLSFEILAILVGIQKGMQSG